MAQGAAVAPTFAADASLARFIDADQRTGKRPAVAAFIPNPDETYLSVNSIEVEPKDVIADYYREAFQDGQDQVAICTHKIREYTNVAKWASCQILLNATSGQWEFDDSDGKRAPAYRYRPVKPSQNFPFRSVSHCGVEFVRALSDLKIRHIARRLAKRKAELFKPR